MCYYIYIQVCMFILSNLFFTALIIKCHVQHVEKILEGGTKELSIIWILLVECTPCLLTSYPGILCHYFRAYVIALTYHRLHSFKYNIMEVSLCVLIDHSLFEHPQSINRRIYLYIINHLNEKYLHSS